MKESPSHDVWQKLTQFCKASICQLKTKFKKKKRICQPMQETQEMPVQSLGQEDPWRRKWQPIQYSCLENPMDRGAWWATGHEVTKSWT